MPPKSIPTDAVGVRDAAKILALSQQRIRQLAYEGRLGVQIAGHWLFDRAELVAFKRLDRPVGRRPKSRANPKKGNGSRK